MLTYVTYVIVLLLSLSYSRWDDWQTENHLQQDPTGRHHWRAHWNYLRCRRPINSQNLQSENQQRSSSENSQELLGKNPRNPTSWICLQDQRQKYFFLKKDVQKAVILILKVPRLFVFTNFSHLLHKNFYLYSILLPSIKWWCKFQPLWISPIDPSYMAGRCIYV